MRHPLEESIHMSILQTLAREHGQFRRLIHRLEEAADHDESAARREIQNVLLVLFPALETHEEIEDLVFDPFLLELRRGRKEFLAKVKRQHRLIHSLKKDVLRALEDSSKESFEFLRTLILQLCEVLKHHLGTEEQSLWPEYLKFLGRSVSRSLDHRASKKVRELELDILDRERAIEDYLGSPR